MVAPFSLYWLALFWVLAKFTIVSDAEMINRHLSYRYVNSLPAM